MFKGYQPIRSEPDEDQPIRSQESVPAPIREQKTATNRNLRTGLAAAGQAGLTLGGDTGACWWPGSHVNIVLVISAFISVIC